MNYFCKTDADVYYPAEIGIVKFSLEDGLKDCFHRFVDPGWWMTLKTNFLVVYLKSRICLSFWESYFFVLSFHLLLIEGQFWPSK